MLTQMAKASVWDKSESELSPSEHQYVRNHSEQATHQIQQERIREWRIKTLTPNITPKTASRDSLHIGLGIPKPIGIEIHNWAEEQDWPEGTELEPIEDYHITVLFAPEEGYDHKDDPWIEHEQHAVSTKGIKAFPSKEHGEGMDAIVLTVDSETMHIHHKELARNAEKAGIEISPYSHDEFKPHMTIAYGKLPSGLKPPKLTFETEPSSVSPPRPDKQSGPDHIDDQKDDGHKDQELEGDKAEEEKDQNGDHIDKKTHVWRITHRRAPYEAELLKFADSWAPKDQWPNALRERNGEPVDAHCTCKDEHKLDCPVHGMHPTLPTYDDTLEFPDPSSPVGYDYHGDGPRTWMRAETKFAFTRHKLWLDDTRHPPDESWDWAKDAAEAKKLTKDNDYDHMSLDHDLGIVRYEDKVVINPDALSGGDFVIWLHEHRKHLPKSVNIHSHNGKGIKLMKEILEKHTNVTTERAPDDLEEDWAREFKVHEPSEIEKEAVHLPERTASHQLAWLPGSNLPGKGLVTPSGDVHTWPVDKHGIPHHAEYVDQRQPYQLGEGSAHFFQIRPRGGVDTKGYNIPANIINHVLQTVPSLRAGEHTDWHFADTIDVWAFPTTRQDERSVQNASLTSHSMSSSPVVMAAPMDTANYAKPLIRMSNEESFVGKSSPTTQAAQTNAPCATRIDSPSWTLITPMEEAPRNAAKGAVQSNNSLLQTRSIDAFDAKDSHRAFESSAEIVTGWHGSSAKRAFDEADTREYQDARQMPPTTMQEPAQGNPHPEKEGCTCEEGHKLDCPVHGLNPTEQDSDHSWSIPQGHPVGYPQNAPDQYTVNTGAVRRDVHSWDMKAEGLVVDDSGEQHDAKTHAQTNEGDSSKSANDRR